MLFLHLNFVLYVDWLAFKYLVQACVNCRALNVASQFSSGPAVRTSGNGEAIHGAQAVGQSIERQQRKGAN